ncbi:hypothetical protein [Actinosynnema sp. NPDC020468]|uniref:hypothetical protein n=1 Tax=Actinosynnema sp. NPDC020468 TaxID=3154488 RepID=UPI0033E38EB8
MSTVEDRMVALVWSVAASCQPPRRAKRTALRVLRDHWHPPTPDDRHARNLRGRLVTALRHELGAAAEAAIATARVLDELTLTTHR